MNSHQIIKNYEVIKLMLGSGLVSGISVSLLNYLFNKKLKHKEAQLRILDRIVDKQIAAYDNILNLVSITRTVSVYPEKVDIKIEFDKFDYPLRFAGVLYNRDTYYEYMVQYVKTSQENIRWLDTELVRELYFVQDYLVNLNTIIDDLNLDEEKLRKVGVIIKQDFIDMAANLEHLCLKFYNNEVTNMKLRNHNDWHKHPIEVTDAKFKSTNLIKHKEEIYRIGES